ncbi:hypothetical protein Tco_1268031 [Tanacetum coccineum]
MKLTEIFSGNGWEVASLLNFLKDVGRKEEEEEAEDFDRSKLEVNDEEQESESGGGTIHTRGTETEMNYLL